jgi:hypothetical protein
MISLSQNAHKSPCAPGNQKQTVFASGVLKLGDSNPRGKRAYCTLRIPSAVVEQVFRERAQ